MEQYIKSAAVYRSQHLRHALAQAYLADNCGIRIQLADEIEDLERRLLNLRRTPEDYDLIHTYREMLYARLKLYKDIS